LPMNTAERREKMSVSFEKAKFYGQKQRSTGVGHGQKD